MADLKDGIQFRKFVQNLSQKQMSAALRQATQREATKARRIVEQNIAQTDLHNAAALAKQSVRAYKGTKANRFTVTVKPRSNRGKGIYRNSRGLQKPVAMFLEDGTKPRRTKSKGRTRRAHDTGRVGAYRFVGRAEDFIQRNVESDYPRDVELAVMRQAKRAGLV